MAIAQSLRDHLAESGLPANCGWEAIRVLGVGARGRVVLARRRRRDKDEAASPCSVCCDILALKCSTSEEVRALKALGDCAHVINLAEHFWADDGAIWACLECLEGGSLRGFLRSLGRRKLSQEIAIYVLDEILAGLEELHCRGWMHRDVKAENIGLCVTDAGDVASVKLMDFDTAVEVPPQGALLSEVLGTLENMAPEVFEAAYDERADCWSLGVVAFELIFGYRPFNDCSASGIEELIRNWRDYLLFPSDAPVLPASLLRGLLTSSGTRLSSSDARKHRWLLDGSSKEHGRAALGNALAEQDGDARDSFATQTRHAAMRRTCVDDAVAKRSAGARADEERQTPEQDPHTAHAADALECRQPSEEPGPSPYMLEGVRDARAKIDELLGGLCASMGSLTGLTSETRSPQDSCRDIIEHVALDSESATSRSTGSAGNSERPEGETKIAPLSSDRWNPPPVEGDVGKVTRNRKDVACRSAGQDERSQRQSSEELSPHMWLVLRRWSRLVAGLHRDTCEQRKAALSVAQKSFRQGRAAACSERHLANLPALRASESFVSTDEARFRTHGLAASSSQPILRAARGRQQGSRSQGLELASTASAGSIAMPLASRWRCSAGGGVRAARSVARASLPDPAPPGRPWPNRTALLPQAVFSQSSRAAAVLRTSAADGRSISASRRVLSSGR